MNNNDLISRAVLLKDLSYCAPELWQDEEYIKAKIMKQSTIDAIPVEWIQAQVENEKRASLFRRYAEALLTIWQKEQEAQDG